MEQIFIMFNHGPPLWDNFVGQKGGAMTSFAGGTIKKDVCYCSSLFSTKVDFSSFRMVLKHTK